MTVHSSDRFTVKTQACAGHAIRGVHRHESTTINQDDAHLNELLDFPNNDEPFAMQSFNKNVNSWARSSTEYDEPCSHIYPLIYGSLVGQHVN